MGKNQLLNTLLPLRFLCTLGHLTAAIMVLYQRDANIISSLPSNYSTSEYDSADASLLAAIWLTIICIIIELFGLFGGFSIFINFFNGYDILAHFVATLMLSWFIMEEWHYTTFWYIFAFFSFIPAFFEVTAFIRICCCRTEKY